MSTPLRIAVLECDTPLDRTKSRYGSYGGVFESLLQASVKLLNQSDKINPVTELDISKWDVVESDKYPSLENIDAVLITGSKHNSYDDIPWINRLVDFISKILTQDRVRIIGVCFGHQILGRALGAKVGPNEQGWEISVHDMNLTDKGKELFGTNKLCLQQMHRDVVHYCPSNVTLLGSSSICDVQGMYIPGHFISVQGHPEFTKDIVAEILDARHDAGIFSSEIYEDGVARLGNEHDGLLVGKAFLEFLIN
ncbi:GMP synthase [Histoplasma capsulatum]|uniref:GMP synthase n=1 Tax=Ajellomyces capsulatus TaxID=5037 RepID=A0A8A1M7E7_AJECA|nr:conserved hypothetical protein [Histoplasma mississippiense (nom. inval.)]EDN07986.1 conserved hypothetical protein [Histoplasma mississippiense (nom. inval.)]QSS61891.1 GMP synthase [Histoplasma capsulatum]